MLKRHTCFHTTCMCHHPFPLTYLNTILTLPPCTNHADSALTASIRESSWCLVHLTICQHFHSALRMPDKSPGGQFLTQFDQSTPQVYLQLVLSLGILLIDIQLLQFLFYARIFLCALSAAFQCDIFRTSLEAYCSSFLSACFWSSLPSTQFSTVPSGLISSAEETICHISQSPIQRFGTGGIEDNPDSQRKRCPKSLLNDEYPIVVSDGEEEYIKPLQTHLSKGRCELGPSLMLPLVMQPGS